jgi:hypothetical protein
MQTYGFKQWSDRKVRQNLSTPFDEISDFLSTSDTPCASKLDVSLALARSMVRELRLVTLGWEQALQALELEKTEKERSATARRDLHA